MTQRPVSSPTPNIHPSISSPEPAQQKRTLAVLVIAQVFSGAGLAAGITVGALLAQDMLGATSLAGLPSALFTIGSAAAAAGVGHLSQRAGRRGGLALGYLTGAVGSLGVVTAAVLDNIALLFVSLFVYGAGTATNLQARYAGADLALDYNATTPVDPAAVRAALPYLETQFGNPSSSHRYAEAPRAAIGRRTGLT